MSRVEQMEEEIAGLNASELKAFRECFAEFDSELWDRQMESDIAGGKLSALSERTLGDHKMGALRNF